MRSRYVFFALLIAITSAYVAWYRPARRGSRYEFGTGQGRIYDLRSREQQLIDVAEESVTDPIDVVIVGGGSTGTAAALEALSRGLRVAVFESDDFGAGTSSRSTKLLHGGVRYLKKAFTRRDISQLHLVREALAERSTLFNWAPYMTRPLRILTPVYTRKEAISEFLLLKVYDWISFPKLASSEFISRSSAIKSLPGMKSEGLVGAVAYYDGQFDDARMNLMMAMTTVRKGGYAVNHAPVVELLHNKDGQVSGVVVENSLIPEDAHSAVRRRFTVHAKSVINASGIFADEVRRMDNPDAPSTLVPASGIHIVFRDSQICQDGNTSILIPNTEDGRVMFVHPYKEGHIIAGTTDSPTNITNNPKPTHDAVDYVIRHLNMYLNLEEELTEDNMLAAWSGIRPLRKSTDASETAQVSREHGVFVSPSGLHTIVGGKWTTVRQMAVDIIDKVVANVLNQTPLNMNIREHDEISENSTKNLHLIGADQYNPSVVDEVVEILMSNGAYTKEESADIAERMLWSYGDQIKNVLEIGAAVANVEVGEKMNFAPFARLSADHTFIEADVYWAFTQEYAFTGIDVVVRRLGLSIIDVDAAKSILPRVCEIGSNILSGFDRDACVAEGVAYIEPFSD